MINSVAVRGSLRRESRRSLWIRLCIDVDDVKLLASISFHKILSTNAAISALPSTSTLPLVSEMLGLAHVVAASSLLRPPPCRFVVIRAVGSKRIEWAAINIYCINFLVTITV